MNYYVLQVKTRNEDRFLELAKQRLAEAGLLEAASALLWPRRKLTIRKKGKKSPSESPIFPGYIFYQANEFSPQVYWVLKRTSGYIRVLQNKDNIEPLKGDDRKLLLHFLSFGEIVDKSKVTFDENNRIVIMSGPMKGLEGKIVKVDRRKMRAKIQLSLYRESHTIDLGFESMNQAEDGK